MPKLPPADDDVYSLTARGSAELKASGTSLAARALETLILVDGRATVRQIAASSRRMPRAELGEVLRGLLEQQLITAADEPSALESGFFRYMPKVEACGAHPEAESGVASLKDKGYYVRIARRAAPQRPRLGERAPAVLLIDDDPDLAKLITTFFRFENLVGRVATRRDEIMAAFRESLPDLVLLDVELPDANGFDVLGRMRQHAVLKSMPVIMITAEATREAVLKGLQAGADGYITKPFDPECVVVAVREVLGLAAPRGDPELGSFRR